MLVDKKLYEEYIEARLAVRAMRGLVGIGSDRKQEEVYRRALNLHWKIFYSAASNIELLGGEYTSAPHPLGVR